MRTRAHPAAVTPHSGLTSERGRGPRGRAGGRVRCRGPRGSAGLLLFPGRIRRRSAGGSGAGEAFRGDTAAAPLLMVAVVTAPRCRSPAGDAALSGAFRSGAGPGRGGAERPRPPRCSRRAAEPWRASWTSPTAARAATSSSGECGSRRPPREPRHRGRARQRPRGRARPARPRRRPGHLPPCPRMVPEPPPPCPATGRGAIN